LAASDPSEFEWLILPADLPSVRRLREFVMQGAQSASLADEKLWKLELALEEALVNVIRHAYSGEEGASIHVGFRSEGPGEFCVMIRDEGRAFDPLSHSAPDLSANIEDRPIGGLGIFFMRHMADEIEYERIGGMNRLTLRFFP